MANSTIFDDVFRTMLEKMPQLIIPLINEVFGTDYPGDIPIVQRRNEHYTRKGAIITDSHLFIADYIFKESSRVKKGIGEIMGGQVLELESDKMIRRAQTDMANRMLDAGKYGLGEISEMSGLSFDRVRELWEKKNGYEHSGGQVLELESERLERLIREGCEAAREEGREEGRVDFVTQLLRDGKYNATEISQIFGVPMEQIMRIRKEKNL